MERQDILAAMSELKLLGMRDSFDEIIGKGVARRDEFYPLIAALIRAEHKLLDDHICAEIADILNAKGIRPGGSARRDQAGAQFTDMRVIYLVKQYGLRPRYDRLRDRGMLTTAEACAKLGITVCTLVRWAKYGIVKRHAYNGYIGLYDPPGPHVPAKKCSRWDQLIHRAETIRLLNASQCNEVNERAVV